MSDLPGRWDASSIADELHTAKWIQRLHVIADGDPGDLVHRLTVQEADALITLIAKQRNRIGTLQRSRDAWRGKCRSIGVVLGFLKAGE